MLLAWLFFFIAVDFKDHKSTVLAGEHIKQTNKQAKTQSLPSKKLESKKADTDKLIPPGKHIKVMIQY